MLHPTKPHWPGQEVHSHSIEGDYTAQSALGLLYGCSHVQAGHPGELMVYIRV